MTSIERTEVRAIIQFCRDIGKTPTQTFEVTRKSTKSSSAMCPLVFKWFKRFEDGRTTLNDDKVRGRKSKISQRMVTSVHAQDIDVLSQTLKALSRIDFTTISKRSLRRITTLKVSGETADAVSVSIS